MSTKTIVAVHSLAYGEGKKQYLVNPGDTATVPAAVAEDFVSRGAAIEAPEQEKPKRKSKPATESKTEPKAEVKVSDAGGDTDDTDEDSESVL